MSSLGSRIGAALVLPLLVSAALHVAAAEPAVVRDLGTDFSVDRNPNGPWQYGFSASASLALEQFTLARDVEMQGRIGFWHPAGGYYPYVAWNPARRTLADPTQSWALRPHEVALEASNTGQYAIVRFVAPVAGRHRVQARFAGIHFRRSTTDVHVRVNDTAVFDAIVDGYGGDRRFQSIDGPAARARFTGTYRLAAGDVVTFAVGYGPNATNFNDTTGLRVRIVRKTT
jgi:hypothetical protein